MDAIVAVLILVDNSWFWTNMQIDEAMVNAFLPRGDHYIGLLELLAPLLALGTWPHVFQDVLWTAFVDNSGALHALKNGSSVSPEANVLVGRMWHTLCQAQVAFFAQRVESKSNVAGGPTRHDFSQVSRLGAEFTKPQLPAFVYQVWH